MKFFSSLMFCAAVLLLTGCDSNDDSAPGNGYPTRFNVTMMVGDVIYDNVAAIIEVTGYSESNVAGLTETFEYVNDVTEEFFIRSGHHHYKLVLKKWGYEYEKEIDASDLHAGRANGPKPVTITLGGTVEAKRLRSIVRSMETTNDQFRPLVKTDFQWEDDDLITIFHAEFNEEESEYRTTRRYDLSYDNGKVSLITGYHLAQDLAFLETHYEYFDDGKLKSIHDKSLVGDVDHAMEIVYHQDNTATATVEQSNGQSYVHDFKLANQNIIAGSIKKFGETCNSGSYGFDRQINPFRHLGFVDMGLNYLNINNRIYEDIEWFACAFPDVVIDRIEYDYNTEGYPLKRTSYWSNGKREVEEYSYY